MSTLAGNAIEACTPRYAVMTRAVLLLKRDGVPEAAILETYSISRRTYYRWLADARAVEARRRQLRVVSS